MELHAVVMAGGRGERFWPLSRAHRPKQLLRLLGEETLVESTVRRALQRTGPDHVWVIAGNDLREALLSLKLPLPPSQYIWETVGRNTAPAVGAAAECVLARGDADLLVLPSDHWIPDSEGFWDAVDTGRRLLSGVDALVTFGIHADYPETGYGYVERGQPYADVPGTYAVARFHEKPNEEEAAEYLSRGGFYWNSGIFLFRASTVARELRLRLPVIGPALDRLRQDLARSAEEAAWVRYFEDAPSVSFDHGVMESAERVAVVEARFSWSDLGNFRALGDLLPRDGSGNRAHGQVMAEGVQNSILLSEPGGLLAVIGVRDLIVVRVGDATLVCPLERAQDVRRLVQQGKVDDLLRRYF